MKHSNFYQIVNRFMLLTLILGISLSNFGQQKSSIAVSNIDTRGVEIDPVAMGNLVRIELEKKKIYDVLDKYDMKDLLDKEGLDLENCYGRTCIVNMGKVLNVDIALTGSVERFGDKLVFSLRLFDVKTGNVINTDVSEYQFEPQEIDIMARISLNNIFNIENDENLVQLLANYEEPISTKYTNLRLNGPRMGVAYVTGDFAQSLMDPIEEGGYDGYPILSQLGYQHEIQYLSAGNFNALIEMLGMVSGLEQGLFIPAVIFMNGFRFGEGNWEIAFGPSVSLRKEAQGYYDNNDKWHLDYEWYQDNPDLPNPFTIVERMDSRGSTVLASRWIWAFGKTFQSGYLNIPCNVYFSPMKQGWYIGASVGFNVGKRKPK